MNPSTATPLHAHSSERITVNGASEFGLIELRNSSPLVVQVLPGGALFALRHGSVLINQLLPGPAEDGLFRLLLRGCAVKRDSEPGPSGWAPLVGAGLGFSADESGCVEWNVEPRTGLVCRTRLELHPTLPAWAWRVRVRNQTKETLSIDVLHAQDLGLADEAAVRNNEAYTSQYIDLLPLPDEQLGWTILARQNQPAGEGRHPWLVTGCCQGAEAFCTDGWQFFGADHRLTGEPAAVRELRLPSKRLQYEAALAGLQSRAIELAPGAETEVVFVARFLADHAGASGAEDVSLLREAIAGWAGSEAGRREEGRSGEGRRKRRPYTEGDSEAFSLFTGARWIHGDEPAGSDLREWFPGPHRQVETDAGRTLAFFCGDATHVVTRAKEAHVLRPHGHVLRSGDSTWIDDAQFGVTAYAAGIFSAQSYLGNPNLARLLPVVRNALGVARAAGQRVFVREGADWRQLGMPSAFAMTPGDVRWIYRLGDDQIEARVWCSARLPAALLELRVVRGEPREFLITHQLALGANEFDHGGTLELHHGAGWVGCTPGAESFTAKHLPDTCFAIAADDPASVAAMGGDELIYRDGARHGGPYLAVQTRAVGRCGIIQTGSTTGPAALSELVASARGEFAGGVTAAEPAVVPLRLRHADAGVGRIAEVLPWFNHNAAIHFSAPHGLEQYGGAAWGVRDVCQGSIEWLLTSGRYEIARRVLTTVFAQQYLDADAGELTGTWPQWFMFPPFHFIQQAHSHGDVCFWPVKALCDYAEAANDVAFLGTPVGYTDPKAFTPAGPQEPLWAHCDRVIAHAESRFVAGTALVSYGDGDWDDTLQPADPAMRSRMISAWTVGLAYHTFRQLAAVARRAGEDARASRLEALLARMRSDFARHLMPDGIVAGFLVSEARALDGARPLLHPRDQATGIRHRLLPMTRSVIAELFTPAQAERHRELIERELRYPDGVRLMSEPAVYQGGLEKLFKRADTAANIGREIGLQYVHAHLRYAEAMAKLGDADRLWWALQVVNPVGLTATVPHAALRQSNTYFSSSDADFADRYEAAARWAELREGRVAVRGGWRLYSSGPGLFLHKVRACLLGLRESFDEIVFDPVLPRALDGLVADVSLCGHAVEIVYHVKSTTHSPRTIVVNDAVLAAIGNEANPYRPGGLRVSRATLERLLTAPANRIEVEL